VKAAIVILNWNGLHWLQHFLPDVVRHSPSPAEVWIADNGSTDESLPWVRTNYPTVKIFEIGKNLGFSAGYNIALKYIHAPFYILLNSDVKVTPHWLEAPLEVLKNNPEVGAVQPKILSFHQPDTFEYAGAAGGMMDHLGYPFCRGRIFNVNETDHGQFSTQAEIFWASGAALFIRKEAWEKAGGLDVDFFAHMEEIDLCWRLKNLGFSIRYVPDSVVFHVGGGTLAAGSPRKIYLNFRNNLFLLLKNLPKGRLAWLLPLRLVLDGIAALKFLAEPQGPAKCYAVFKAHLSFYRNFSKMVRKRKQQPTGVVHPLFMGSVVWNFFILGIRTSGKLKGTYR
jgi:GT2 family glycosyltransferase